MKRLFLNNLMNLQIPDYYQDYLSKRSNQLINGFPLYGYDESPDGYNLETANMMFNLMQPNIAKEYLVIRFFDALALLIHKASGKDDLFQINIEEANDTIKKLNISFSQYMEQSIKWLENRKKYLERIEGFINKSHDRKSKKINTSLKARDWKVIRSAVHDFIVALVAFRYNEQFNAMDVAAFLVTDLPNYEPGHGIKAGLNMLFSAAYKSGSSFEIRFVSDAQGNKKENIPEPIIEFTNSIGVTLDKNESIITHEKGLKIYSHVSGVNANIEDIYNQIKGKNNISLQGLCFLSNLRIWENHEIKFVLTNSRNPEGLLFGKDLPENWNSYEIAIQLGRNIVAVTKFRNSIETLLEDVNGKSMIDSVEDHFILSLSEPVLIDITLKEDIIKIDSSQEYIVFPRVRRFYLEKDVQDDLQYLQQVAKKSDKKVILIYSSEIKQKKELTKRIEKQSDLITIVLPVIVNELDEEIIKSMKRAKSLRT